MHPFTFWGAAGAATFAGELFLGAVFFVEVAEKPVPEAKRQMSSEVRSCFMQLNDVLSKIFLKLLFNHFFLHLESRYSAK